MSNPILQPRITRQRVLAGLAIFVAATLLLWIAGVDMSDYLLGTVAGVAIVGVVLALSMSRKRKNGQRV